MDIPFSFEFQTESVDDQPFATHCACLLISATPRQTKLVKRLQHYFSVQVQLDQAEIEGKFGFLDYQATPGTACALSSYDVKESDIPRVLQAWHHKLVAQGFTVAKPVRLSPDALTALLARQTPVEKEFAESLSQSPDNQAEARTVGQSIHPSLPHSASAPGLK